MVIADGPKVEADITAGLPSAKSKQVA